MAEPQTDAEKEAADKAAEAEKEKEKAAKAEAAKAPAKKATAAPTEPQVVYVQARKSEPVPVVADADLKTTTHKKSGTVTAEID